MATDFERFQADAKANGFDPKIIADTSGNKRAHRAYIALKLFQIEEHMRRLAEGMAQAAVIGEGSEGIG